MICHHVILRCSVWLTVCLPGLSLGNSLIDNDAEHALNEFYAGNSWHQELGARALGILVFPKRPIGKYRIRGECGSGALLEHDMPNKYFTIAGAVVSMELGVAQQSAIILFMTQAALDSFKNSRMWTMDQSPTATIVTEQASEAGGPPQTRFDTLVFYSPQAPSVSIHSQHSTVAPIKQAHSCSSKLLFGPNISGFP